MRGASRFRLRRLQGFSIRLIFLSSCWLNTGLVIKRSGQTGSKALAPEAAAPVVVPHSSFQEVVFPSAPRPQVHAEAGRYQVRLAQNVEERDAACRLRFRVFNIELGEGLRRSFLTGMDTDDFDLFCEHLIVEDRFEPNPMKRIVGTYRMQSGLTAQKNLGYYSAQEFHFAPFEALRHEVLELGRASIAQEHRTSEVLTLLWRGIAQYAGAMGLRYLIGCSSLNSQDPTEGWQIYGQLQRYLAAAELQTLPRKEYLCPQQAAFANITFKVPKLLRTYLTIGARICAPPAWDREFGTIDFLTLLDLKLLTSLARNHFLISTAH